jgi:hypothetical protein
MVRRMFENGEMCGTTKKLWRALIVSCREGVDLRSVRDGHGTTTVISQRKKDIMYSDDMERIDGFGATDKESSRWTQLYRSEARTKSITFMILL